MKTLEKIVVGIGVCLSLAGCSSKANVEDKLEVRVYKIPAPPVCKSDARIELVGYGKIDISTSPVIYCKGASGEELVCDAGHYNRRYSCYQIGNP
mgnify:CR=1 FL=1